DEAELRAAQSLKLFEERQADVRVEVALVEFVEDHTGDPRELGIVEELAQQRSLREIDEARPGAGDVFEPHPVAHGSAERLPLLLGDTSGGQARRDAPGLRDEDAPLAPGMLRQGPGEAGGLARARRSFDDQPIVSIVGAEVTEEHTS